MSDRMKWKEIFKGVGKVVLALAIWVGFVWSCFSIRMWNESRNTTQSLRIGRIVWEQTDKRNDISEISLDGVCVVRGCIELLRQGDRVVGLVYGTNEEDAKMFAIDVAEDAMGGVEWWNQAIDFFRAGGRKFDFSKLKTFWDWKHGAK